MNRLRRWLAAFHQWFFIDAGSFTGALVGGAFTILAGYVAWYGVQKQIEEQRFSTLLAYKALLSNELSQNTKKMIVIMDYMSACSALKEFVDLNPVLIDDPLKGLFDTVIEGKADLLLDILVKTSGNESDYYIDTNAGVDILNTSMLIRNIINNLRLEKQRGYKEKSSIKKETVDRLKTNIIGISSACQNIDQEFVNQQDGIISLRQQYKILAEKISSLN